MRVLLSGDSRSGFIFDETEPFMATEQAYLLPVTGGEKQQRTKQALLSLLLDPPKRNEELIANLPLYLRSVMLAKILYVNELYELVDDKPGVIMEFGVWWGANLALLCNLRAVHDPYNGMRKVIGFDTFTGYPNVGAADGRSPHAAIGGYAMPEGYERYLEQALAAHEADNTLDHKRKFELVKGDAAAGLADYLKAHPETVIALAYLDMAMYEPTRDVLKLLLPHMVKGGVIALDELGSERFPGETRAFKEVIGAGRFQMRRSRYLPDRTILIVE
jgi:hypothetical protein